MRTTLALFALLAMIIIIVSSLPAMPTDTMTSCTVRYAAPAQPPLVPRQPSVLYPGKRFVPAQIIPAPPGLPVTRC